MIPGFVRRVSGLVMMGVYALMTFRWTVAALASTELLALEDNISKPTQKKLSRIASFLLCADCRVHKIKCAEIVRRIYEKYE